MLRFKKFPPLWFHLMGLEVPPSQRVRSRVGKNSDICETDADPWSCHFVWSVMFFLVGALCGLRH